MRADGRETADLRPVKFHRHYIGHAEGSVLVEVGKTRVICTVSLEEKVPPFLKHTGRGWVTAEYAMLPRATVERNQRESTRGAVGGRTHEIQRLIGRSLRAVVDLSALGERTAWVDCDVIEADGGTRTASITGAFVALCDALYQLYRKRNMAVFPITDYLAAISVGLVKGVPLLDLAYSEDAAAGVDMNVVMTGNGKLVEVQGTGEETTFTRTELLDMLALAESGIGTLVGLQQQSLGDVAFLIGGGARGINRPS
ncbi:MAG: Ribonuclease PH [Firmicutes bacterium]|nr:Ribonuclease PH [candidate division NPL-UPA2 bacterium]